MCVIKLSHPEAESYLILAAEIMVGILKIVMKFKNGLSLSNIGSHNILQKQQVIKLWLPLLNKEGQQITSSVAKPPNLPFSFSALGLAAKPNPTQKPFWERQLPLNYLSMAEKLISFTPTCSPGAHLSHSGRDPKARLSVHFCLHGP